MSLFGWIILGIIAGWIGSHIVDNGGKGPLLDMVLGIVGALVGGEIFSALGAHAITGLNLYSLFVAVIGSVVVLVIYHAAMGRRRL
ncbi:MAG: transglycosylase [Rhodospirillales bacterium 20-64-7]|nr:MAG: transglycosylase [Rhodospirillales bacterium 20-64-7]